MVAPQVTESSQVQNQLVDRLYRRTNLVSTYSSVKILPPEATAFVRYRDDIVNRRVLDLGCGAGRLAVYLQPLVARYAGFDISPYMIQHCQREYPDCDFAEGDMRDLSRFPTASFDSILAVSNLFDAVSHADRLKVLAEVHRVLTPGGLLFFSAHNRHFAGAGEGPQLVWHRNPVTQLRLLVDYGRASAHHRRLKQQQRFEEEYALLNDSGNNFASLHYYINRDVQLRQLIEAGFQPLECLDSLGRTLSDTSDDSEWPSIHYLARSS